MLSSGHVSGISGVCEAVDEACCVALSVTEAVYGVTASAAVLNYIYSIASKEWADNGQISTTAGGAAGMS